MSSASISMPSATVEKAAGPLLLLGIIAGPFYLLVGLVQVLLREGFDIRRHALSHLSNGEFGWVQITNFLFTGLLVIAGAIGCRRAIRTQPAGTWGPILLGFYGAGLIGAGVFPADPAPGFPPGTATSDQLSTTGLLHFAMGGFGFYALIAACFVFMRRFLREQRAGLAWYSAVTGAGFFASFAAVASGSTSPAVLIAFYVAVVWTFVWHTLLMVHIARQNNVLMRE